MSLLPVDVALAKLVDGVESLGAETVALTDAGGRVLAAPLHALRTQPPFRASAMDGYAVRAADAQTVPARLNVIGEAPAGRPFAGTLQAGSAVRIFTGAPVPEGADSILLQEDAEVIGDGVIEAREAVKFGRHIRAEGLDFRDGDLLLRPGRLLDPAALSLAAAANHAQIEVVRRPRIALLATGDELLPPGSQPGPGQIIASNTFGIASLVRSAGGEAIDLGIVPDDRAAIADAVERATSQGADIIVTLGGASVGDHDLVREVLTGLGMDLSFWRIAMRPGKPLMVGRLGNTHVIGLPGNPVSSLVCAHLFLLPLIARLGGRDHVPDIRRAVLGSDMPDNDKRRDYVRASAFPGTEGLIATPFATQDSSMLRTLAEANCLIIREAYAPAAPAGTPCRVLMLR